MSDNYVLALEQEREIRQAELVRLRSEVERLVRLEEEARDQARVQSQEWKKEREAFTRAMDEALALKKERDEWRDRANVEMSLKEQAERDRDAAMETARKAHEDWETTVARAEKAEAERDAARAEHDRVERLMRTYRDEARDMSNALGKAEADCAALVQVIDAVLELSRDEYPDDCMHRVREMLSLARQAPRSSALLERLRAAEAVVEAARPVYAQPVLSDISPLGEALDAYDAVVKS